MSDVPFAISLIATSLFIGGIIGVFNTTELKSDKPITPELRITIKDNQIDTVYIYRNDNTN